MRYPPALFGIALLFCTPLSGQNTLYDDTRVSEIHVSLPADSLKFMLDQLLNDRYMQAEFVFDSGTGQPDTVRNIGLRLRGNTSLAAKKKSFKVSFNEFESGCKYQGVKKLNLLGSHNDPTMVRQKLFYDVWAKAGMPLRRGAFVKLYINGTYRGLYTNMEEIDKEWLKDVFGDDDGNLYKCTWPASLAYLGTGQQAYKALLNNPETRAYDLTTNETEDDYSRFVTLVTALHQPADAAFSAKISQILNTDAVLKAFALDVATGNWDDYFYNKNNYYLYDNPATGRFEFVTYDTDNSFGVDWLNKDWATRNCLAWHHPTDPRPLASKLLAVPAFQQKFVQYLDTITRLITCPDALFPRVDALHNLVASAAETDLFRTLDYGYTTTDFHKGFEDKVDAHTPYGIKPFLAKRCETIRSQIAPLISSTRPEAVAQLPIRISPNPVRDQLLVQTDSALDGTEISGTLTDLLGRNLQTCRWQAGPEPFVWPAPGLSPGIYFAQFASKNGRAQRVFVVVE